MRLLLIFIVLLIGLCLTAPKRRNDDAVLLRDVETLTLNHGEYTTARRTTPIAQLKCVGGIAKSQSHKVKTVQCYNKGFDGRDVTWKCETVLDDTLKLGKLTINCEGYNFPEDPYVTVGSCGLEYYLEYTDKYYQRNDNDRIIITNTDPVDEVGIFFVLFFVVVYVILVLWCCIMPRRTPRYVPSSTMVIPPSTSPTYVSPTYVSPVVVKESSTSSFVNGMMVGSALTRTTPTTIITTPNNPTIVTTGSHRPGTTTIVTNSDKSSTERETTSYGTTTRR